MTQYQPHTPPKLHNHGFTLVELMVTIAVMGIVAAMAAPSLSQAMANQRMKSTTSSIESVLQQAKVESRIRKKNVTINYTGDSITSSLIVPDDNTGADKKVILDEQAINSRSNVTSSSASITITPAATATATTFTICDGGITGETGIQVQITNTAQITTSRTGVCS